MTNYSDAEERWFAELRPRVLDYVSGQGFMHGPIGDTPAWFVDPYVSIWADIAITLTKALSGGQTGLDRGALDAALVAHFTSSGLATWI